jgi:PAS domain S-box-containing protein
LVAESVQRTLGLTRDHALPGPRRADELLRLAIQVGGVGIFETDLKRKRTRFSPELCTILEMPAARAEMASEDAWKVVHQDDRPAMRAAVEAAATSDPPGLWSGVYRLRRSDGTIRWASMHGRRIYRATSNGAEPMHAMGVVIDITKLKETEDALRESELRLRFALDAAQMGTFVADTTARTASIDAQQARLFGLPVDTRSVCADELRKRVPLQDLRASDFKKERLTAHGEAYQHEFRFRMMDGSERWLSSRADVRSDRVFGVTFDITQQKQTEAQLRDKEERLRVATRGAALGVFEWNAETNTTVWENGRMRGVAPNPQTDEQLGPQSRH